MTSAELSGWFEYLRLDDEVRAHWLTHAIVRAFRGDTTQQSAQVDEDGEEIIDTTQPEFAEKFKGFINQPAGRPQRNIPGSTQILMG